MAATLSSTPAAGEDPVSATSPLSLKLIATGEDPTYLTHAGDERLFIVERDGRIRIYQEGRGILSKPFLAIDGVDLIHEGGLLSVAFHPRYAENGFFYVDYTFSDSKSRKWIVVSRYRVSDADPNVADPDSEKILLKLPRRTLWHNGGQLQFSPRDGYLYVSIGIFERGPGDPVCLSQKKNSLFGKLLRLDVNQNTDRAPYYGVPLDNPFNRHNNKWPQLGTIWATGLRNPWRFSFDRKTGDLYLGDVGHHTREEINFQSASSKGGENYGWKIMEGNFCFALEAPPTSRDQMGKNCPVGTPPCYDARYSAPITDYPHEDGNCGAIGGYVYRGTQIPSLQGRYVFGDLCSARIWTLQKTAAGGWSRMDLLDADTTLVTFGEDRRGELHAVINRKIYRFVAASGQ